MDSGDAILSSTIFTQFSSAIAGQLSGLNAVSDLVEESGKLSGKARLGSFCELTTSILLQHQQGLHVPLPPALTFTFDHLLDASDFHSSR